MRLRALLAAATVAALIGLAAPPALADDGENVKFYEVPAGTETLTEVAERFLGDGARSAELFNLNAGRRQPDGAALTDPDALKPGWRLVLPWDAHGAGVRFGPLTGTAPAKVPGAGGATARQCDVAPAPPARADWANLRLAAGRAWPRSRGSGQLVAVVDSGVDGGLPRLRGHVAPGTDVITGGRGDTDCLGTGTAMAGLIAAQPVEGGPGTGIAPDATVLPIRIAVRSPEASPANGASAIAAAVTAGATVIALGAYVDLNEPEVARAAADAAGAGVVVVGGAPLESVPAVADTRLRAGVLRVGGIGMDNRPVADYRSGAVDLVAPGVNVGSVGLTAGQAAGSGTHYAVAFVAGQAALVRAAYPALTPAQVQHRMEATATSLSGQAPDGGHGWGLIAPEASVTAALPEEARPAAATDGWTPSVELTLLIAVVVVALVLVVLLTIRIRRLLITP
ncbi:hypothetical protein J2S43_007957 [Catenuloplanes nepalensis]|uniref:Peptidase S8/S53 domain-containing protein n=1 Tax=Catenuloplanes nepalensis TaxID=587533 RepID=A0ABT9N6Y3_9ACTN|nr:S8 family serine peptidase [Catenuloplanes nepalensis]MDP9799445.1 hypothetical protein [Catenuloplanes nepalensis]